jgi:membrane protease YdiL (CAAX protease family)
MMGAMAEPQTAPAEEKKPRWRGYFEETRDLMTSVVLVLPLFVAYQIGILTTGGVRNGVDFMTDVLFALTGGSLSIYLAINAGVLIALLGIIVVQRKRGSFRPRVWWKLLLESTVYAVFFGAGVSLLANMLGFGALLSVGEMSAANKLVMSIGAGLYEELVFRLFFMGGLFALLHKALKRGAFVSGLIALVVSSVVFSAVHHVGNMGEAFTVSAFTFRFFAGVLLGIIYWARGFAVAVYTHAIYDVIVLVLRSPGDG